VASINRSRTLVAAAALQHVITKGIAQWKRWINETLGQPDSGMEIAGFIQDTDYLRSPRRFVRRSRKR
jgi:hypothetical protein